MFERPSYPKHALWYVGVFVLALLLSAAFSVAVRAQTLGGSVAGFVPPRPLQDDAGAPHRLRGSPGLEPGLPPSGHPSNIVASRPLFKTALPLGATLLGYVGGAYDSDPGGYQDSFKFQPDKQAHLLASVVLSKAVADRTSPRLAFATCLLAGAAWEAGQARHHGYSSPYDFGYDGAGCLAGALWGRK